MRKGQETDARMERPSTNWWVKFTELKHQKAHEIKLLKAEMETLKAKLVWAEMGS